MEEDGGRKGSVEEKYLKFKNYQISECSPKTNSKHYDFISVCAYDFTGKDRKVKDIPNHCI